MAKLTSLIKFSGTLDGITSYTTEGSDDHIVRLKGGSSREKILHDPCFENTRRNMSEFGARGPATHLVLEAFQPLRTGQGVTGRINKLLRVIQKMDAHSAWGERAVALSVAPGLLRGLNISKRLLLDNILPVLPACTVSKENLSAQVEVPALLPGVNCTHPKQHPFFRVVAVLGVVPDIFYYDRLNEFLPAKGFQAVLPRKVQTPWQQTNTASPATTLEPELAGPLEVEGFSLLLSLAIEYGRHGITGAVEPVNKAVASKILAVG